MGVFDGAVKVGRAVADPKTDKDLPSPKSLSWGAIKSASALAGTTGTDSKLVHGDRWQQVAGSMTENYIGNVSSTIAQDETHKIAGNRTKQVGGTHNETICGTSMETIIGAHVITNMNILNETRLGTRMQVHGALEWQKDQNQVGQFGLRTGTAYVEVYEAEVGHNEIAASHFEAKGQHNYFSVNDNNCVLFKFETKELNAKAEGAEAKVTGLKGDVKAMQAKVGGVEAKAVAAIPTAGADVNPTPLL